MIYIILLIVILKKIKNSEISDKVWVYNIMNSNICIIKINNKIKDKVKIFYLYKII